MTWSHSYLALCAVQAPEINSNNNKNNIPCASVFTIIHVIVLIGKDGVLTKFHLLISG